MIKLLAKIAQTLDAAALYSDADQLDCLIKNAGAERHRELPIIASVVLFRKRDGKTEILLEKRKEDPRSRTFALPGGHVEKGKKDIEDFAAAASRELEEETGVVLKPADLSFVSCRPRQVGKAKLEIVFMAVVPAGTKAQAGSDADDVMWTPIGEIPDLAFEHNYFVELAIKMLNASPVKKKLDITGLHGKLQSNRGLLIAIEGLDGAGKTSQIEALGAALSEAGYDRIISKWASSDLLKKTIKAAKEEHVSAELYSLLHVTDMHERYSNEIVSALAQDKIVICDRYLYTSFARDIPRGINPELLKASYSGFRKPDLVFYCKCPIDTTVKRLYGKGGNGLGYYGSGQDMHLDSDPKENLKKYQKMVDSVYLEIMPQVNCVEVDTSKSIKSAAKIILQHVLKCIEKKGM